jgi:hypothetical protein
MISCLFADGAETGLLAETGSLSEDDKEPGMG